MPAVRMPGPISGIITLRSTLNRVQPSIMAASSRLVGDLGEEVAQQPDGERLVDGDQGLARAYVVS